MAETVRSELPNLWRSMNEPRACRHLYQICPQTKGRFERQVLCALVDRCDRGARAQSIHRRNRNHRAENHHDDPDHLPGWGRPGRRQLATGLQGQARASRIACQMCSLVAGMSRPLTPSGASASTTALTIAGSAPTVPASPAPLAPSGLRLVGTGFEVISMYGIVSARGMQ